MNPSNNLLQKINNTNAHIIYFLIIVIAIIINLIVFSPIRFNDGIEIAGTFIQIALPCYVLVPILVNKDGHGAKQMLAYLGAVLIITYILKYTLHVKRPYGGLHSFPSGHTVGAFSGAVFLSFRYGKKYAFWSLPIASFVAFSRVYTRNHWISDVCGSIILCFFVGIFMIKKYSAQKKIEQD